MSPCVNCGASLRMCKECDWYNGEWISKDQYKARLKADMVTMLTEILTDFDNQIEPNSTRIDCESIIEQKIDELS